MEYVNQVKNPHGTVVIELLSDPHFTFKNVLGADKVETQNGKIKAEIPLKGLVIWKPVNQFRKLHYFLLSIR